MTKTKPATKTNEQRGSFFWGLVPVMPWRIRDWDRHFETHKTRILKRLAFVPIPNKLDGDGFTLLMDHADGIAHYGAWCLIVLIASKCDPRGALLRDAGGSRRGAPAVGNNGQHVPKVGYEVADLARISRAPESIFRAAIPRLVKIGWLEEIPPQVLKPLGHGVSRRARAGKRRGYAGARPRARGTEKNGIERNQSTTTTAPGTSAPSIKIYNQTAELIAAMVDWDRTKWQPILEFCRSLADRLPERCRPLARIDSAELIKVGALKVAGAISEDWIETAITKAGRRTTRKPLAAFHAVMAAKCSDAGLNFNRLLKGVTLPDWFK